MNDTPVVNIHDENLNQVHSDKPAEQGIVCPKSRLVEELIDEKLLFADEIFLESSDFAGKRILIVTSNPVYERDWYKNADEIIVLSLDQREEIQDEINFATVVRGNPVNLKFADNYFDYVFIRDVSVLVDDIIRLNDECSRVLKEKGSLILLSLIQTDHSWNNLNLAEHFEQNFAVIVEKHLEYFPRTGKQSIEKNPIFMYERLKPERFGILIARLEKSSVRNYRFNPVPPYKVDGYSYSTDKVDTPISDDQVAMSDSVMKDLAIIGTNPEKAFLNLRKSMDQIYTQLGSI